MFVCCMINSQNIDRKILIKVLDLIDSNPVTLVKFHIPIKVLIGRCICSRIVFFLIRCCLNIRIQYVIFILFGSIL